MASVGEKRKLEDTDIAVDADAPPAKQQKLAEKSEENAIKREDAKEKVVTETEDQKDENEKPINTEDKKDGIKKEEEIVIDEAIQTTLRTQIEYYFGDSNLSLDKFIQNSVKENDGFLPLSSLLTFAKIAEHTQSPLVLIKIIESSSKLQLNEKKTGVRRHPSMGPPPTKHDIYKRTIFAKGFHPRFPLDDLQKFWNDKSKKVLSVRGIKDKFEVGISDGNKQKIVNRFLGSCSVEFTSEELAQKFSKLTFDLNGRIIRCGMYKSYFYDEISWTIKRKYLAFESGKVLFVRDIPTYSTQNDVRKWIELSLNAKERRNGIQCVYKEMNAGSAYVRFGADCDVQKCVKKIKRNPLMRTNPKLIVLNDENAQKIWKRVAWKIGDDDIVEDEGKDEMKDENKDVDLKKETEETDKNPKSEKEES